MDNKELKENIVNIIKAYSNLTTGWGETVRDFILNEDNFEDVAEEIANLLPIHNVSKCTYCGSENVTVESDGVWCRDCAEWESKKV
jgi:hypothetical protein